MDPTTVNDGTHVLANGWRVQQDIVIKKCCLRFRIPA